MNNLPDFNQYGNPDYKEERRKLKENDPYKVKGAFNPREEYYLTDDLMYKYYVPSETMIKKGDRSHNGKSNYMANKKKTSIESN